MSPMYPTLDRLYKEGKLTNTQLLNAVSRGWITETERQQIVSQ